MLSRIHELCAGEAIRVIQGYMNSPQYGTNDRVEIRRDNTYILSRSMLEIQVFKIRGHPLGIKCYILFGHESGLIDYQSIVDLFRNTNKHNFADTALNNYIVCFMIKSDVDRYTITLERVNPKDEGVKQWARETGSFMTSDGRIAITDNIQYRIAVRKIQRSWRRKNQLRMDMKRLINDEFADVTVTM
jgi:hypothetical protein